MATFWVNEHWTKQGHRAQLHRGTCAHCNEGQGEVGAPKRRGRWHGPFTEIKDALAVAHKTGAKVSRCGYCKP
jgi:hypothetical protein